MNAATRVNPHTARLDGFNIYISHAKNAKSAKRFTLTNHADAGGVASFATTKSAETLTANL